MTQTAFRSQLLTFNGDPAQSSQAANYETDGLLVVDDGKVVAAGPYAQLAATLARDAIVHDLRDKLIVPGFIDTHIHYPQTDMIASPAPGLLPWLDKYTFPTERQFGDPELCARSRRLLRRRTARLRHDERARLLHVHKQSADALFAASDARDLRMIAGKVLMDRNCPEFLRDTAQSGYDDSAELIDRWHGKGRQMYALTPRFAPTSTEAQLEACSELARRHPDVFVQSHVAENVDEVKWVAELFPGHRSYLDIYDRYGLLRRARCTATASTSTTRTAAGWPRRAPSSRTARRRTSSSAAGCSISTRPANTTCPSRSRPTSAAARRFRCCRR